MALVLEEYARSLSSINSLCFSPDGKLLAFGTAFPRGNIELRRVSDGQVVKTLKFKDHALPDVLSVCFSPDGNLLASGTDDGILRLWQVDTGRLLIELEASLDEDTSHVRGINLVGFSPDGRYLAVGSHSAVLLYRIININLDKKMEQGVIGADSVCFSHDSGLLVAGSYNSVKIWAVSDGSILNKKEDFKENEEDEEDVSIKLIDLFNRL